MSERTDAKRFADAVLAGRLDVALLAIAAHDHDVDIDAELATLDALAATCSGVGDITELAQRLFVDGGFRGNHADYYDADNSFLDRVLARRLGIPITLSVLLMEVGRRVGIDVVGVGAPGHFLTRSTTEPYVYIDAFNGGTVVTVDERAAPASPPPAIAARVLHNLQAIFLQQRDAASLAWVRRLLVLVPDGSRAN
jgi:regulator of sirC expression with transglutaminase-like and TPR domain